MTLRKRLALVIVAAAVPIVGGLVWVRAEIERRTVEQALRDFVVARMENGGREECEASPETFSEPRLRHRRRRPGREGTATPPSRETAQELPGAPDSGPEPRGPQDPRGPQESRAGPEPRASRPLPVGPELRAGPNAEPAPDAEGSSPAPASSPGGFPAAGRERFPGPPGRMPSRWFELFAYSADFVSANPNAPPFPPELREALAAGDRLASREYLLGSRTGLEVGVRMDWSEGPCAIILAHRLGPAPSGMSSTLFWSSAVLCAGLLAVVLAAAGPTVGKIRRLTGHVRRSATDRYATPVAVSGSDEIAELARAFNDAGTELRAHLAALEERERTLREFVAATTHDVATPLTVLQGHLVSLRKAIEAGRPPERNRVLDALEEAHYMASLLHNLGAAAKLEAGSPTLETHPVDLNRVVERAVGRHRPIAEQRSIALDFAVPEEALRVAGDETLIEQAVSNVIQNAVRYNNPGGHVVVVLERRPDARTFSIRVIDDGPGVPEDEIPQLGKHSFRGSASRTRHPGGLGLGLNIARNVAERHDFEMTIRRSEAGGLEVQFTGELMEPARDG